MTPNDSAVRVECRRGREIGHRCRRRNQDRCGRNALPRVDRLAQRDRSADREQRRRNRRWRRHHQRGRRRKPQRPHAASAQVCRRADRPIVDVAHPLHDFTRQNSAEDQGQPPADKRRCHREKSHEGNRALRRAGNRGEPANQPVDGRRRRHHVSAHDDDRHLHRERNQAPESFAEIPDQIPQPGAQQRGACKHDEEGREREHKRIREPSLRPIRQRHPESCKNAGGVSFRGYRLFIAWLVHRRGLYALWRLRAPDLARGARFWY